MYHETAEPAADLWGLAQSVHAELALVRGAVRASRDLGGGAGPTQPWQGVDPGRRALVDQAAAVAGRLAPGQAGLGWHEVGAFELPTAAQPLLYRVGATRVTTGPGGFADLPVLVPLLDAGHLAVTTDPEWAGADPELTLAAGHLFQPALQGLLSALLVRVLTSTAPGSVLLIADPNLPACLDRAELREAGLLYDVDPRHPGQLGQLLDVLSEEIRRIRASYLQEGCRSLAQLAAQTGHRPEPWRVVLLSGLSRFATAHQREQLAFVINAGPACGIHGIFVDTPVISQDTVNVLLSPERTTVSTSGPLLDVALDGEPYPGSAALDALDQLAAAVTPPAPAERPAPAFADLLPGQLWTASSAGGLATPVGGGAQDSPDAGPVTVELGDAPSHGLVLGPTGSGKTNLIYALLGGLAARYSPEELQLYLLDFKEGVSFAQFAPGRRDPSWLPHARLVGVNINADREFGLALLRFLAAELRRRAAAQKHFEVTKLEQLRAADPTGHWPRVLAVIDEFQCLIQERDQLAEEAVALLGDLARRGRSQGIHLLLASQGLGNVETLWGRSAILDQFTLRVALPKAVGVLKNDQDSLDIPRWHAIVNPDSGAPGANQLVRLPDCTAEGTMDALQRQLWDRRSAQASPPVLFDGDQVPELATTPEYTALTPGRKDAAEAFVGRLIDVVSSAATVRLDRAPGRNLVVLGNRAAEACDVLGAAMLSLGRQHTAGSARFTLVTFDQAAWAAAENTAAQLRQAGHQVQHHTGEQAPALLAETAAGVRQAVTSGRTADGPHYLALYVVDAGAHLLQAKDGDGTSGHQHLVELLRQGPQTRTHLLGWWRTVPRLREDLGGFAARFDDIGAWVALDAQGADLAPLPGGQLVSWHPRERRGLFFDRSVHQRPGLTIPYRCAAESDSEEIR